MSTPKPGLYPGDLRAIGAVLALAGLIVTALLISIFGASIMKRILLVATSAIAALAVSGCNGLSALTGGDTAGKQILTNLQGCKRHYSGAIGAGVNGSFEITCDPVPAVTPPDASAIPKP